MLYHKNDPNPLKELLGKIEKRVRELEDTRRILQEKKGKIEEILSKRI